MQLILMLLLLSIEPFQSEMVTLEDLKWESRVLITLTNNQFLNDQIESELQESEAGVLDRHINYYLISPQAVRSNNELYLSLEDTGNLIHDHFDNSDHLKVLLIGKDSGIKLETEKFNLKDIFRLIDSMPMRQQEIKNN